MEIILKYEQALNKAQNNEKLNCHYLQIKCKLDELKSNNYKVSVLDEVWVDYFLHERIGE